MSKSEVISVLAHRESPMGVREFVPDVQAEDVPRLLRGGCNMHNIMSDGSVDPQIKPVWVFPQVELPEDKGSLEASCTPRYSIEINIEHCSWELRNELEMRSIKESFGVKIGDDVWNCQCDDCCSKRDEFRSLLHRDVTELKHVSRHSVRAN